MKITPEQREAWLQNTANSPFNRWLEPQVRGPDGQLDLARLYEVASRYGIDGQSRYSHLNPGQQRMIVGNILRRIVPADEYEVSVATPQTAKQVSVPLRPEIIRTAGVTDLLILHSQIMDELREREIVRTANAPLGDYAELLFATAFGWALQNNSSNGHDATDASGHRYQIKSRRVTPRNPSRQLSAIRRLPDSTFDFLAAVLFDETYRVTKAIVLPHAVVARRGKRVEHTNSWRFILDDGVWAEAGARDVTAALISASETI
ncbi:hypothetical protein RFM23_21060 [Mesorhizobium abyssinicae]|uniref:Restriction endonuclease n=1 Tax=Mesorhizobium abyssinicae TaxID=1209958 RepID=A0ABU5AS57_9HYPH|nr:hypothetical protein [Mesorhizobium abyssinicae]MDX8540113.1 hypothetical protein [Mesorhizobium abyssinicae]